MTTAKLNQHCLAESTELYAAIAGKQKAEAIHLIAIYLRDFWLDGKEEAQRQAIEAIRKGGIGG